MSSEELTKFIEARRSVFIASLGSDFAHASQAPFVEVGGQFFILISSIAPHFSYITERSKALSVMLCADESECDNIFARARVSWRATAFSPKEPEQIWSAFERKFPGPTLAMLRGFSDFSLVGLELGEGRAVMGFGAAFSLRGLELGAQLTGEHKR